MFTMKKIDAENLQTKILKLKKCKKRVNKLFEKQFCRMKMTFNQIQRE